MNRWINDVHKFESISAVYYVVTVRLKSLCYISTDVNYDYSYKSIDGSYKY